MSPRCILIPWLAGIIAAGVLLAIAGCEGGCLPADRCESRGGHYELRPAGGMTCYNFGTVTSCEPNTASVCVGAR